jgi:hypothetical protein
MSEVASVSEAARFFNAQITLHLEDRQLDFGPIHRWNGQYAAKRKSESALEARRRARMPKQRSTASSIGITQSATV